MDTLHIETKRICLRQQDRLTEAAAPAPGKFWVASFSLGVDPAPSPPHTFPPRSFPSLPSPNLPSRLVPSPLLLEVGP